MVLLDDVKALTVPVEVTYVLHQRKSVTEMNLDPNALITLLVVLTNQRNEAELAKHIKTRIHFS